MRNTAVVILSALLGGLIGGLVIFLVIQDSLRPGGRPARNPRPETEGLASSSRRPTASDLAAQRAAQNREWATLIASANSLVTAGKLQEAQEAYLTVLLMEPGHQGAMRGLVRVVRLIFRGDNAALRRQAQEYRRAIAHGLETEEHYTAPAMEILARASLEAAGVRATEPARRPPAAGAAGTTLPSESRVSRRPSPPAAARPAPPARIPRRSAPPSSQPPRPAAPRPAAPPPAAPLDVNEPFFVVAVGPVPTGDRASAITAELTVAGFTARARRQEAGNYLITLGPYRQSEARRAAAFVRSRFGEALPVVLTPAR